MYDPISRHNAFAAAIAALRPCNLGLSAPPGALEIQAEYIGSLTKLVAEHVEAIAADVASAIHIGRIDEEDARGIADIGSDIAGRVGCAADLARRVA